MSRTEIVYALRGYAPPRHYHALLNVETEPLRDLLQVYLLGVGEKEAMKMIRKLVGYHYE